MRSESDTESITYITRKYVQVNVEYFLPGRRAVREEEIHSFAPDLALAQRRGNTLGYTKHLRAVFLVQIYKMSSMSVGNYKRMPGIDWLNVHESRAAIILMDHADLKLA